MSIRLTIAAVYGAAAIVASGFAEAMPERAYDETLGGQLEARLADGYVTAELLHTDIDARIVNDLAEIHLRQVFAGMGHGASDVTYLLPMGAGAEVIAIEVAEGTRIERRALDPVPTQAPRMFAQNLDLGGEMPVEITVIYRQPMRMPGGERTLVLPIATMPGGAIRDEFSLEDTSSPEYADLPEYLGGELVDRQMISHDRIDVTLVVDAKSLAGVYSDTHAIDVTATADARVIELAPSQPIVNQTFVLNFDPIDSVGTVVAHADRSR